MSDEGKYPFEGSPDLSAEFKNAKNESDLNRETNVEEEVEYDEPKPALTSDEFTQASVFNSNEVHMALIMDARSSKVVQAYSNEKEDYDVIRDNAMNVDVSLKEEWDSKIWEEQTPEVGED